MPRKESAGGDPTAVGSRAATTLNDPDEGRPQRAARISSIDEMAGATGS